MKHQPYRKNDGSYSCRACQWTFWSRPNKKDCPGILRIERASDEYKTRDQWRKLGFEVSTINGRQRHADAVSIVHSTNRYLYYHRDHVQPIKPAP